MARPRLHGPRSMVSRPHPVKDYRETIRLIQYRRGPHNPTWEAQVKLPNGEWTRPFSLKTDDPMEAAFNAVAALGARAQLHDAGLPQPSRQPAVKPPAPTDTFGYFAGPVIVRLREEAKAADNAGPDTKGKGHCPRDLARRIERDLLPRWGDTRITDITEADLNDWVADEYRVEDTKATVGKYGRQPRGPERQIVWKRPAANTLGNLDAAFALVWDAAVKAQLVDRRNRPVIDKTEHGEEGEARSFIDSEGVVALAKLMDHHWLVSRTDGHTRDYKQRLRVYVALLAGTGIRPGLELKRVQLRHVQFKQQVGTPVIIIQVMKSQGKHKRQRPVVVYENDVFDVRALLEDLIRTRRQEGAKDTDLLFAWAGGGVPSFRPGLRDALIQAGCLVDPMTGEERVAYSFRHYFATKLIELGLSVIQIAEWLGTSSDMIHRHYNRFLTERNAHLLNGFDVMMTERRQRERVYDRECYHPADERPPALEYDWTTAEWYQSEQSSKPAA